MTPEPDCDTRLAQCLMEIRHSAEHIAFRSQELYKHADERLTALRRTYEAAAVPPADAPKPGKRRPPSEIGGAGSVGSRAGGGTTGEAT